MSDASHQTSDSRLWQLSEYLVRASVMALVLTGQMLPAGAVTAQEPVVRPSVVTPVQPPSPFPPESITDSDEAATSSAEAPIAVLLVPADATRPQVIPSASKHDAVDTEVVQEFHDWRVTIRPGIAPARRAHLIQAPVPHAHVSVPVTINIHHEMPLLWHVPSTYSGWWTAPTTAYLFQRPLPYWQLRGDFFHLRPFIPGLWF